jgi:hypothetical protein
MIPLAVLFIGLVLANGALLWLIARMVAPADVDFSLSRGLVAGFILAGLNSLSRWLVEPKLGEWSILVGAGVTLVVVMGSFRLAVVRSVLVTVLHWVGFLAIYIFVIR